MLLHVPPSLSSLLFSPLFLPSFLSLDSLAVSPMEIHPLHRRRFPTFPRVPYILRCVSPLFLHLFFLQLTTTAATVLVRVSLSPRCTAPAGARRSACTRAAHTRPCTTHTSKRELSPAGSAGSPSCVCVLAGCTGVYTAAATVAFLNPLGHHPDYAEVETHRGGTRPRRG